MRRVVVVALLIVAGGITYRHYVTAVAPIRRYEQFAEELLRRRYDAAAGLCDGLTQDDLAKLGSQERIGGGPSMFQTLFPSRFEIKSHEVSPDGSVAIHAIQTVRFNPVGVESAARPAMNATLEQVATLRRGSDGWRITAFENAFLNMSSNSGR
jgi:hypothetical protein